MIKYNPLDDSFYTIYLYLNDENLKKEGEKKAFDGLYTIYLDSDSMQDSLQKAFIQLPLMDDPVDISELFIGINENGIPIVRNIPQENITEVESGYQIENPTTEGPEKPEIIEKPKEDKIEESSENPNENIPELPTSSNNAIKPTISYNINKSITGNKKVAIDFFVSKKLPSHVVAGIVGNLMWESGDPNLNKTNKLGDEDSAYGIAQWRLDRRSSLRLFATKRGKPMSDFLTLLEFIWHELNNNYKNVLLRLLKTKTVKEATTIFMQLYERPSKDPTINGITKRIKYAESLLS